MYLTCLLIEQRGSVNCPKPGPDALVCDGDKRVWIEAVAATQGDPDSEDRVPDPSSDEAVDLPEEQILLRYLTVIDAKRRGFDKYAADGLVSPGDPCVIAVSAGAVPMAFLDEVDVPRIASAVFPFGDEFLEFNPATGASRTGRLYRPSLTKSAGASVSTSIFLEAAYERISALFYSGADISNPPEAHGEDLVVVHNPRATNPLEQGWLGCGHEYVLETRDAAYELVRIR